MYKIFGHQELIDFSQTSVRSYQTTRKNNELLNNIVNTMPHFERCRLTYCSKFIALIKSDRAREAGNY